MKDDVLHAIDCDCQECLDNWVKAEEAVLPCKPLSIQGIDGCETYKIDENTIGVRPKWISVKDRLPECEKCLAVCISEKGKMYNMRHDGWFRDTLYACRMHGEEFIIESHGPTLPATHWMPLPEFPND